MTYRENFSPKVSFYISILMNSQCNNSISENNVTIRNKDTHKND